MRRLVAMAVLVSGIACAAPEKRPFTAADLGPAEVPVERVDTALGGQKTALVVLPDGRIAPLDERKTLAPALLRFDEGLRRTQELAHEEPERRTWGAFLAEIDRAMGLGPTRLELIRTVAACEVALAGLRERRPGLSAELEAAVGERVGRLEEQLAAAPPRRAAWPAARRRFGFPIEPAVVTSFYGPRADPFDGRERWHFGVDLRAETGQAVLATATGMVVSAGWAGGHGQRVELAHADGVVTGYSHLSAVLVGAGDTVEAGQLIGLAGATGRATGPHLHFELWRDGEPEDPLAVLDDAAIEVVAEP